jgi:hypothetical protein
MKNRQSNHHFVALLAVSQSLHHFVALLAVSQSLHLGIAVNEFEDLQS